jgi:hypothetical protein
MNLSYTHLLPEDFAGSSRVWIYQADRVFTLPEALEIETMLDEFTTSWMSHGARVKGFATLFFGRFILLMADETETGVSGCSTDSSVRLIRSIEQRFRVNMFDRQLLAFVVREKVELLPLAQLDHGLTHGFIDSNTLYFNNTVQTREELATRWIIPVRESWLRNRLPLPR